MNMLICKILPILTTQREVNNLTRYLTCCSVDTTVFVCQGYNSHGQGLTFAIFRCCIGFTEQNYTRVLWNDVKNHERHLIIRILFCALSINLFHFGHSISLDSSRYDTSIFRIAESSEELATGNRRFTCITARNHLVHR